RQRPQAGPAAATAPVRDAGEAPVAGRSGTPAAGVPSGAPAAATARRRLGYKEARELEALPARIEALEARLAEMTARLSDPAFFRGEAAAITAHNAEMASVQAELDAAYARWEALEAASG